MDKKAAREVESIKLGKEILDKALKKLKNLN